MTFSRLFRYGFAAVLASGPVGCLGPAETEAPDDIAAQAPEEEVATSDAALVTCAPSRAIYNTGYNALGTSGSINYVGASGSNRILIEGRSSTGLTVTRYIDLAGITVSGSWGTRAKSGKIRSIEISGKTMKISGTVNYMSTSATLTFAGNIDFDFSSISGTNVNQITPYPTTASGPGITMGATATFGTSTSNSSLNCY